MDLIPFFLRIAVAASATRLEMIVERSTCHLFVVYQIAPPSAQDFPALTLRQRHLDAAKIDRAGPSASVNGNMILRGS